MEKIHGNLSFNDINSYIFRDKINELIDEVKQLKENIKVLEKSKANKEIRFSI